MSLVKADDACPQVRFGVSIIPTDVRDGSNSTHSRCLHNVGLSPNTRHITRRTATGQEETLFPALALPREKKSPRDHPAK